MEQTRASAANYGIAKEMIVVSYQVSQIHGGTGLGDACVCTGNMMYDRTNPASQQCADVKYIYPTTLDIWKT